MNEVELRKPETNRQNSTERHVFHTIENIGNRDEKGEWRQRITAMVIAVVICAAIYGVLYMAMHSQY